MRSVLSLLVLAVAVCCSSLKVDIDRDEAYDLEGKQTYAWVAGVDAPSELNQKRIDRGVDAALAALGYARDEAAADFLVRSEVASQRELRGGTASTGDQIYEVTVGSLVLEVLDATTREVVWRAVARDTVTSDSQRTEAKLALAIEQAFEQFPPAAAVAGM